MTRGCNLCNKSVEDCVFIINISISQRNDSEMDGDLNIYKCQACMFYFTSTKSTEINYNHYYLKHNNYNTPEKYYDDKTIETTNFIVNNIPKKSSSILDYGCGNKQLYNKLKDTFINTNCYDIDYPRIINTYDYIILSHVLEHIYNPKEFLEGIKQYINKDGYIFIEVPNAECYYDIRQRCGILQEINIEHINFFNITSLSKLMTTIGFVPEIISSGYFNLNNNIRYPVIRGLFKLTNTNSFENYISEGKLLLDNMIENLPEYKDDVIVYGCGQFLYKIINTLTNKYNILAIIDDNPNFINKTLVDIPIYNLNWLLNENKHNHIKIIITTRIHKDSIQKNLKVSGINCSFLDIF